MTTNTVGCEEVLVTWCEEEIGEVLERGPVTIASSGPAGQWTGSGV